METSSQTLGQRIKRYRLINDIRQEDMAENMGISRATLINYEKGHTAINVDVLSRIKKHYPNFQIDDEKQSKPQIIVDNTIDFKVLYSVIFSKKKFILFITLLFAFIGTGSSFLLDKEYTAEISLYPAKNDFNQGLGQFQSLAANLGINKLNNDQDFNIPDVVKSRLIANKVIKEKWEGQNGKEIDLISLWEINKQTWLTGFLSGDVDSSFIVEKAIEKFNQHVNVTEDRITGLIKISTIFKDPLIASEIANFIGNQVELYIQKENSAQSTKEKIFILERLAIVKNELEKSELELKEFKERNRGYEESPELFMIFSQFFREVEVKKEVYLTLQQQLELARIEEVKKSPILHILDHAVPPVKKSSPNRVLFLIIFALFGFMLSTLRTIFRY